MRRALPSLGVLTALLCAPAAPLAAEDAAPAVAPAPDLVSVMAALGPKVSAGRMCKGFAPLSPAELRRAQAGELITRETPVPGASVPRLTMATVMPYPIEALYLVLGDLGHHDEFIPQLDHSVILSQAERGMVREAFQFMGSPYPAQDRGWVTRMENNRALYEATGGQYWELYWSMEGQRYQTFVDGALHGGPDQQKLPADLSPETLEDATTPNFGSGAWVLIPLGPRLTYVEYDSFTDPNPNAVEKTVASALGAKIQAQMFSAVEPLAKAYTEGKMRSTQVLVDMQGGSSKGLIERLKTLLAATTSSSTQGR